jgi:hypothetical protein
MEPETEAPTEEVTEEPTETPSQPADTEDGVTETPAVTEAPTGGCGSLLSYGSAWIVVLCLMGMGVKLLVMAAANLKKKDN